MQKQQWPSNGPAQASAAGSRSPCGTGDPHAGGFFRGPPARDISAPAPRPRRARETWTAGSAAGFVAPAPGPAPTHEGTGLARGLPAAARRLNFKLKFNLAWSAGSASGPPLSATGRRGSRGRPPPVLPWTAGSFPLPAGPCPRPSAGSARAGPAGPRPAGAPSWRRPQQPCEVATDETAPTMPSTT